MKLIFFLLLYASCFSSCTSRLSPKDTEIKALSDSLKVRCNDRIMQTDSLSIEAENFMAHTQPGELLNISLPASTTSTLISTRKTSRVCWRC